MYVELYYCAYLDLIKHEWWILFYSIFFLLFFNLRTLTSAKYRVHELNDAKAIVHVENSLK